MASQTLRALGRKEANFVYRNNRLLIGWRNSGSLRCEAWLGYINEDDAASDHTTNNPTAIQPTTTDWLRVYASSDGSDKMYNGVMVIDEAHPAVLRPHTEVPSFLQQGAVEGLKDSS